MIRVFIKKINSFFLERNKNETQNIISNLTKIAGRSIWQFALPAVLSNMSFRLYGMLQYFTATLIPISNLGNQQLILRSGTSRLPLLAMLLHSLFLVIIESIIISFIFKLGIYNVILLAIFTFNTILYVNLSARLKSLNHFLYAIFIEVITAASYLICLIVLLLYSSISNYVIVLEIVVLFIASIVAIFFLFKINEKSLITLTGFWSNLKSIYNIGFNTILDTILWRFVPIYYIELLPNFKEKESVFYFSLLVGNAAVLVQSSLIESWIPELATIYNTSPTLFIKKFNEKFYVFRYVFIVILVLTIMGLLIALKTIYFKFYEWKITIILFVTARILSSYFDLHSASLYATRNEKKLMIPAILGAMSVSFFTFALYPIFQFSGILLAYIFSRFVLNVLTYKTFMKTFYIK